jgi:excisionase family DNA binding protein
LERDVDDMYPLEDWNDLLGEEEVSKHRESPARVNGRVAPGAQEHTDRSPMSARSNHVPVPRWLSVDEVCQLLELERHTVYRLLRDRQLPGSKIGRRWYIPGERLLKRIEGWS